MMYYVYALIKYINIAYCYVVVISGVWHTKLSLPRTNTFQLVLATDGSRSFALFLYLDGGIEWPNEVYSRTATSGYDTGDGVNYFMHPLSFTDDIGGIEETSNVGVDGLFIFQVNGNSTGKKFSRLQVNLI